MTNLAFFLLLSLTVCFPWTHVEAKEDKALQKQRREAQQERQTQKNERNKEINEASRSFREFSNDLKREYQELLKELDTEFELSRVDLQGDKQAKVAVAQAEYQKNFTSLFLLPEGESQKKALKDLEQRSKDYAKEMFQIRKEAAQIMHNATMANLEKKHNLLKERDQEIMAEAASLGLTKDYPPILATAIGGTLLNKKNGGTNLTKQEERWNEREKKEVLNIKKRNRNTTKEFRNGAVLRDWERKLSERVLLEKGRL